MHIYARVSFPYIPTCTYILCSTQTEVIIPDIDEETQEISIIITTVRSSGFSILRFQGPDIDQEREAGNYPILCLCRRGITAGVIHSHSHVHACISISCRGVNSARTSIHGVAIPKTNPGAERA